MGRTGLSRMRQETQEKKCGPGEPNALKGACSVREEVDRNVRKVREYGNGECFFLVRVKLLAALLLYQSRNALSTYFMKPLQRSQLRWFKILV